MLPYAMAVVQKLLSLDMRQTEKPFVNAIGFQLRSALVVLGVAGQELLDPVAHIIIKGVITAIGGNTVLPDEVPAPEVGGAAQQADAFCEIVRSHNIPVPVTQNDGWTPLEPALKGYLAGNIKVRAIHEADDVPPHVPGFLCWSRRCFTSGWSGCTQNSTTPQTWKPVSALATMGGTNGWSDNRKTVSLA